MNAFQITALNYDGVPLDLTGRRDAEDCWVERVCVAGTAHNIADMLGDGVVERLAELADAQLAREATRRNAETRYDTARMAYELARLARHA